MGLKNKKSDQVKTIKTTSDEYNTAPKIVKELDRYIVGQEEAKKSVAIALVKRIRRLNIPDENLREEVTQGNMIMIGPTGVGKTEIARRIAKIVNAPFIKVEATKYTEVGYVGGDVESIIRNLADISVNMVKREMHETIKEKAQQSARHRVIDCLVGENSSPEVKEKFGKSLDTGELDEKEIEIELIDNGSNNAPGSMFDIPGGQMGVINVGDMISKVMGNNKTKLKKTTVKAAFEALIEEESEKLIDNDSAIKEAIYRVENRGIVFIDEIDKIASSAQNYGPRDSINKEGVQRDLLPLIEGTIVNTKHGTVDTTHILFITSGAFHISKPSDLLPELQGRLPIRVKLKALTKNDLVRILKEPEANLLLQAQALLATEGIALNFTEEAILKIAEICTEINDRVENIGARRLHTILNKVMEDIDFNAAEMEDQEVIIDEEYVNKQLSEITKDIGDLAKFIL